MVNFMTQDSSDESIENFAAETLDKNSEPEVVLCHSEKERMTLAYRVLSGIFIVFLLSCASKIFVHLGYLDPETGNTLFELCKTGLLPIVTLILGYYFSKSS